MAGVTHPALSARQNKPAESELPGKRAMPIYNYLNENKDLKNGLSGPDLAVSETVPTVNACLEP